jgi:membrane protein implicated in regulation of membrane protease activity
MPILILLLGLGSVAATAFFKISLILFYLSISLGFTGLLMALMFLGFLDLGDSGGQDVASDGASNLFMFSPFTFLTAGALFGAYGLITLPLFNVFPINLRDYLSILTSLFLTAFSYIVIVRNLIKILKPTSLSKAKFVFEGKEGDVIEAISENGVGKVAIKIDSETHYLYVRTEDGRPIPIGKRVRIKRIVGDYGYVEEV